MNSTTSINNDGTYNNLRVYNGLTSKTLNSVGSAAVGGVLAVTGLSTLTGGATVPAPAGYAYTGVLSTSSAVSPATLNVRAGTVTFTAVPTILAAATGTLVIDNSLVTANTLGLVSLQDTTAAATSFPLVQSVAYGAGTITITIVNQGAGAATGVANYTFSFILFN